ncbi:MAG TPA: hypothetical protein VF039_05930 [Longimicrobiales bacterium]
MSGWELGTRIAIAVLLVGSVAVFVWFIGDALRLFRTRRPGKPLRPPPDGR